jgi:hypothetical protein
MIEGELYASEARIVLWKI